MSENIISQRLLAARENLGITKAEAARRLNLTNIGYCRYEYGDRTPSRQTLEVIAQCFGTSVDYLTGETDKIEPDKIVIDKSTNPELFELVKSFATCDNDSLKRIAVYANEILKKNK